MMKRIEELLRKHRMGQNLTETELLELDELHLEALYSVCDSISCKERRAKLKGLAWSTVQKLKKIKNPVERMNQAGLIMMQSLKEMQESINKLV